jgi:hypothetical protein
MPISFKPLNEWVMRMPTDTTTDTTERRMMMLLLLLP